jgi:hypothetical protein
MLNVYKKLIKIAEEIEKTKKIKLNDQGYPIPKKEYETGDRENWEIIYVFENPKELVEWAETSDPILLGKRLTGWRYSPGHAGATFNFDPHAKIGKKYIQVKIRGGLDI